MTQSLHPAAAVGFATAAKLYQDVRPSYPPTIQTWLQQQLKLNSNSHILDLGSGTGKFIPHLQTISSHIIAADPVAAMLEQLQQQFPDIHTIQTLSESLPFQPEQFDAVTCAQSFHWFANTSALQEIHRVLKPNAALGLIWNQRDENVPWVKALADVMQTLEGDTPRFHSGHWKKVFEDQTLFAMVDQQVLQHQHIGTVQQVVSKRLLSTSFIAALAKDQQQQLKQQFEQIVFEHTGLTADQEICFPYQTFAYYFQKLP